MAQLQRFLFGVCQFVLIFLTCEHMLHLTQYTVWEAPVFIGSIFLVLKSSFTMVLTWMQIIFIYKYKIKNPKDLK